MSIRPEFEAMRRSRELWGEFVRGLDEFDTTIKLLPMAGRAGSTTVAK